MMSKMIGVLFIWVAVFSLQANAQKEMEGKKFSGGFGIESHAFVGDKAFRDQYGIEFGLSGRFAYKAGPGWITLTPGCTIALPKEIDFDVDVTAGVHPFIKTGYKFIFARRLFAMAEVGYGSYTIYNNLEDDYSIASRSGGICFAPTIGANFGVIELGLKYEFTKISGGSISSTGIRFGFNF